MDEFLKAVLIQIACYVGLVVLVFMALNFWSSGFIFKWFKVKTSMGKKILVKLSTHTQDYYAAGELDEGWLLFKGKNKKVRRLVVPDAAIYRSAGVNMINVDDTKNIIDKRDFSKVPGYDNEKLEDLYTRALYKPAILDNNTKILLILVVCILIAVGFGFYLTHSWIVGVQAQIEALKSVASPVVNTAGNTIGGAV